MKNSIKRRLKTAMAIGLTVACIGGTALGAVSCGKEKFVPSAEIVNKDGFDGVVTFVVDDGNHETAEFAQLMMKKYKKLNFSFAVMTKDFATLTETEDGSEYIMDNGRYVYSRNDAQKGNLEFWQGILDGTDSEIISHSHTHSFWGTDDSGGEFEYVKNNSDTVSKLTVPKGSTAKELYASKQILDDLFSRDCVGETFIIPGISVRTADYKTEDGKTVPTYFTYFKSMLEKASRQSDYIGARSTFQVTNTADSAKKVILPESLKTDKARTETPAFMIVDANKGKSGIENWTAYIDHAVEQNGWACYCIHNMFTDARGHYIYQDDADALFKYATRQNVWIATYTDAMLYYNQWSTSTVTATYKDGAVCVSVSDREEDSVYNVAMTVKVEIPKDWMAAYSGGVALEPFTDGNGKKCVLVNVVPDGETVKVTATV